MKKWVKRVALAGLLAYACFLLYSLSPEIDMGKTVWYIGGVLVFLITCLLIGLSLLNPGWLKRKKSTPPTTGGATAAPVIATPAAPVKKPVPWKTIFWVVVATATIAIGISWKMGMLTTSAAIFAAGVLIAVCLISLFNAVSEWVLAGVVILVFVFLANQQWTGKPSITEEGGLAAAMDSIVGFFSPGSSGQQDATTTAPSPLPAHWWEGEGVQWMWGAEMFPHIVLSSNPARFCLADGKRTAGWRLVSHDPNMVVRVEAIFYDRANPRRGIYRATYLVKNGAWTLVNGSLPKEGAKCMALTLAQGGSSIEQRTADFGGRN